MNPPIFLTLKNLLQSWKYITCTRISHLCTTKKEYHGHLEKLFSRFSHSDGKYFSQIPPVHKYGKINNKSAFQNQIYRLTNIFTPLY